MVTQLPSKMRFVAAQFNALLEGELWLRNARHSNEMAALLYDSVAHLDAVEIAKPQVNGLFPTLPADAIAPLQAWSFFWDWDVASRQVRWMTSWDTTADDVERFAAGVAAAVGAGDVTSGTPVGN
jgi:threonine aldolase